MLIAFVVATDLDGVIGRDGDLPWRLPADLAHFKRTTMGRPIIMGRKTCESIGRALPGRQNIVLTRDANFSAPGFDVVRTVGAALAAAGPGSQTAPTDDAEEEVFVIGGGEIYTLFLDLCERVYRTVVNCRVEGDTYFPKLDAEQWTVTESDNHAADDKNPHDYRFEVLDRLPATDTTE